MAESTPTNRPASTAGDPLLSAAFITPEQKNDKKFGKELLLRIYKTQASASDMFFGGRAARIKELFDYAAGRNTIKEYLDLMKIDGNNAYTGIDPTPNRQGPQFVETLVNSMAKTEEYPCVTAIDDKSMAEKKQRKEDALHRMYAGQEIEQMQDHSGVLLEPPAAYVPEDELSAEVYFAIEDRIPIEITLEDGVEQVMADNEYDNLKRRLLRDGIVGNTFITKIERLDNSFIYIKKPPINNMIWNFFLSDSGKMDLSYIGEVYSLKVRELRKKYSGSVDEKTLFKIAQNASQNNVANRVSFPWSWSDAYLHSYDRPYDDLAIQVFDLEVKLFDADYYVEKPDKFGRDTIKQKKNIPAPTSESAKVTAKGKYTVFRGVLAVASDEMLYWGLPDVVIKPYMDISESLFSYTINIPGNDGGYVPSLFERALSPFKRLGLIDFRIKQILAEMAPPGYSIDVESIRDIELNGKILPWEEVIKIRNQKGVILWSSRSINPAEPNPRPPIEDLPNAGAAVQLNELREQKMEAIQEIRSVLGVPLYRDGSDLPPRMGASVVENQTSNSNNVSGGIEAGYRQCMEETLHKVVILKWDDLVIKQGQTEHIHTQFKTKLDLRATEYEKQLIESQIAIWSKTIDATGNPLLGPKDVFKIRQIKNYKMQDLYLSNMVEQNRRHAQKQVQQNTQMTAQAQQASNAQTAQNEQQLEQDKHGMALEMKDAESKSKKQEVLLQGFLDILKAPGGQIPPGLMPLFTALMQNVGVPLVVENQQMQQQVQAQMQQEAMAAQQQQAQAPEQQQPQGPQQEPQPQLQEQAA